MNSCMFSTAFATIHGRVTPVYMERTRPCNGRVPGPCTRIYLYIYTYMRVHGRYMAVNGPLTGVYRHALGRVHGAHTAV